MISPITSNYVLGQSDHEYERLMLQARILRPYTEKFFRAAGLAPGMRVLEVGSGMGDVARANALDRLVAAGKIREIDRERVTFIVRTIVHPPSGPTIPCPRTRWEGLARQELVPQ